jgi:small-conductance mechanosensitive channel
VRPIHREIGRTSRRPYDRPVTVPLEIIQKKLFDIGGRPVSTATLVIVVSILGAAVLASRLSRYVLHRALVRRGVAEGRRLRSIERLVGYAFMLIASVVALETAGIDLRAVIAATAVFAVGIGLALQGVAVNFVSGIILLVEQSVKIDDIIEVNGQFCRVMDLGIRATRVRTLFEEDIIVPNGSIVGQPIKNLTLHDSIIRIAVNVGVSYGSDLVLVRKTLEEVAAAHPGADAAYPPLVLLNELGDSALQYEVSVWVHDPWTHRRHRSVLREAIVEACRKNGIELAFPQMDVHLDGPSSDKVLRAAS